MRRRHNNIQCRVRFQTSKAKGEYPVRTITASSESGPPRGVEKIKNRAETKSKNSHKTTQQSFHPGDCLIPVSAVEVAIDKKLNMPNNLKGFEYSLCRPKKRTIQPREKSTTTDDKYLAVPITLNTLNLMTNMNLLDIRHIILGGGDTIRKRTKSTRLSRNKESIINFIASSRSKNKYEIILKRRDVIVRPQRQMTHSQSDPNTYAFPPEPASIALKTKIINEWVHRQSADQLEESGCAVCGKLTRNIHMTPLIDLTPEQLDLLTEDPTKGIPSSKQSDNQVLSDSTPLPVLADNCTHVCESCVSCLQRKRRPVDALANGLWIGSVPEQLTGLSFFEKLLISKVRLSMYVLKINASGRGKL